jgi:hypothetical protein
MNWIGPKAVLLGYCASVDEMTIGFQGSHKDKRRITYKAEGDGFQCDVLWQEGYCYQHYFRNDPAPKKYVALGLSPLHARVIWLYDSLLDDHHQIGMARSGWNDSRISKYITGTDRPYCPRTYRF